MDRIIPKPYQKIFDETWMDTAVLQLKKEHFAGIESVPGKMVLSFDFCLFSKVVIENEEGLNFKDLTISFSNSFIRELEITNIVDDQISVHLLSCIVTGRIAASKLQSIQLNNCLLNRSMFFINIPHIRLSYTTENIFPFWWNLLLKRTSSNLAYFAQQDQRYHIENPGILSVTSSKKSDDIPGFYRMEYNEEPYHVGYHLSDEQERALRISLFIQYKGEGDVLTEIDKLNLKSLSLMGNPVGKVAFENTEISNWYLSEFSPKSEAGFYNISPRKLTSMEGENDDDRKTKISIHKCNLDKVWFDNVFFEDFERLSFYRSKFSGATFTSCSFPDSYAKFSNFEPVRNIHYPKDKTKNYDKDQYEIFLQLKKAMENTGNSYESLKIQAVSHAALRKIESISGGDRFILSTSDLSNEHGQSIGRPFWWFLGVSFCSYTLYLWVLGRMFQPTKFDGDLVGYYFSFIDLTHRSDFLVGKAEINGWALAIDYLTKLILGYLIYQFVAAFRKYARK